MLPVILGPQAIGTDRLYIVGPILGPDGKPLTATVPLTGYEPLAARIWQGEGGATLVDLEPAWDSTADGTIALPVPAPAIAGLFSGRYRIDLTATIGGATLAVLPVDSAIDLVEPPGTTDPGPFDALATPDLVIDALGRPFGRRPDLVALIEAASRAIESECKRTFTKGPVVDVLDGNGRPRLLLSRPPVDPNGLAVTQDGVPVDNPLGDQWRLDADSGILTRGDGRWAAAYGSGYPAYPGSTLYPGCGWDPGYQNIQVSYTGGFDPIPAPIRQACIVLVKHLADATKYTGLFSMERIGDYEYTIDSTAGARLPWVVGALIAPYVLSRVG